VITLLTIVPSGGAATHEGFSELRGVSPSSRREESDEFTGSCWPDRIRDFRAYLSGRQTPWHEGKTCGYKMRVFWSVMNQLKGFGCSEDSERIEIRDCEHTYINSIFL
jgi:hypothetical protein